MAINPIDAFFRGAADATGVRITPNKIQPLHGLAHGDVIFFRDPRNAGFATRPPELGIVTHILHNPKDPAKKPLVLNLVPLTPVANNIRVPNTAGVWVIHDRQDKIDMGLNQGLNYKLGFDVVFRTGRQYDGENNLRIIPVSKLLLDPDPARQDTVMLHGRCPPLLMQKLDGVLERRLQLPEVRETVMREMKQAYANRDNLAALAVTGTAPAPKPPAL